MEELWKQSTRLGFAEGVNAPGVEPVKHEQEDQNDEPHIGKATLLLSGKLPLVNFCEAVDEGDRQYVGDENGCHRLKEGYRVSGAWASSLWLAVGAMGCVRSRVVVSLRKALALIVLQSPR